MEKDNNLNQNSAFSTQQQNIQKSQQKQENETSRWVRNFVAISNCFPNFGKGMCWLFGSFILLTVVIFILKGHITSEDLTSLAKMYLQN